MSEFVCEHGLELCGRQRLQQRQADAHHAPAAEAQGATPLRDPDIGIVIEVDVVRHPLMHVAGDLPDEGKQPGLGGFLEARSGWIELIASRHQRQEDGNRQKETGQRQAYGPVVALDRQIGDAEQHRRDPQGKHVEPDHQSEDQNGAQHQPRRLVGGDVLHD